MRNTKYALPLVLLPFLILGAWVVSITFPPDENKSVAETQTLEGINSLLPDPSLSNQKDKFQLLQELLERRRSQSGMQDLIELQRALESEDELDIDLFLNPVTDSLLLNPDGMNEQTTEDALAALHRKYFPDEPLPVFASPFEERQPRNAQEEELRLMREQMARIESLLSENQENVSAPEPVQDAILIATKADIFKTSSFNTLTGDKRKMFISAILDEAQTVVAGSRIRIRLMDDIFIGDYLFKQGTYLYGLVSGFTAQRVMVNITSALYEDQILKLNLTIYDNDGIQGLYVPNSDFRDMMQRAGGQMVSGSNVSITSSQNPYQQLFSQMGQDFYRSVTSAVSTKIRQNKAKLKYASIIYLINEEEIRY